MPNDTTEVYRRSRFAMNDSPEHWAELDIEEMTLAKAAIRVVRSRMSKDSYKRRRMKPTNCKGKTVDKFSFRSDYFEEEYTRALAKLRSKNDYRKNAAKTKSGEE